MIKHHCTDHATYQYQCLDCQGAVTRAEEAWVKDHEYVAPLPRPAMLEDDEDEPPDSATP